MLNVVVQANTQKVKPGVSGVQGCPQVYSKFQTNLRKKRKQNKQTNKQTNPKII